MIAKYDGSKMAKTIEILEKNIKECKFYDLTTKEIVELYIISERE